MKSLQTFLLNAISDNLFWQVSIGRKEALLKADFEKMQN